jgi:hypothetical protein
LPFPKNEKLRSSAFSKPERRSGAGEAIADDPNDPSVLRWVGHTLGFWGDYDRALTVLEKAARLNVNGWQVLNSGCAGAGRKDVRKFLTSPGCTIRSSTDSTSSVHVTSHQRQAAASVALP